MTHNVENQPSESVEQANQPLPCANGCGFFANPACQDMCSKCYRELERDQQQTAHSKATAAALSGALPVGETPGPLTVPAVLSAPVFQPSSARPVSPPSTPAATTSSAEAAAAAAAEPEATAPAGPSPASEAQAVPAEDRPLQKNPGRCFSCNKRVGLTGFKCRCEYVFCGAHRLAEAHDCSYDYKKVERQRLARNNPLIAASKVDKF